MGKIRSKISKFVLQRFLELNTNKQYYGLDEVGFVGGQRSKARVEEDIAKMVQYLKDKKADKPGSRIKKSKSVIKAK